MKTATIQFTAGISGRAFTLVELLVATAVGSTVAGAVLLLLCQTATEQRYGFADMTVEEKAYELEADITSCLRCMSANQGMTPVYSTAVAAANGVTLGYQSIDLFYPSTNGAYITGNISYNAHGEVIYTSNVLAPSTFVVWMSNSSTAQLTQFYFSSSLNLDGSQNDSLVNVVFQMNDNGFSQQNSNNNPASVLRNFSVQMRNDN
jgi:prepilin-type N-terminal cleavage/methylation domain-containing protein